MASTLSLAELNASALDRFIYQPVSKSMIAYLADAAFNVIACDSSLMPAPMASKTRSSTRTPEPQRVRSEDGALPSLDDFITQLVCSSNVQVPTLMSTLVYLTRLRSRLQPMARGLRCTTHRIFLAALILAAKYLNDSSPKNKHWANYSHISTECYDFGFSRTEVNLMEKQLLFLLDWDLRITEDDLYRELDPFLTPIRDELELKHARRMHRRRLAQEQKLREQEYVKAAAVPMTALYPTPPSSRANSRSRSSSREPASASSPPELTYSNSGSPESATTPSSSRSYSRMTTPLTDPLDGSYMCINEETGYMTPVEIVDTGRSRKNSGGKTLLPYEISAEELRDLQEDGGKAKRLRMGRNVFGRVFGAVSVR